MKFGKQRGNADSQTPQERNNQQVSAFAQAIARELPDFRLVLEKSKLGRFVATLTYNKDYSPIRYTVPRMVLFETLDVDAQIEILKKQTALFEKENEMMRTYPHLFIQSNDGGYGMDIWVREEKDGIAFGGTLVGRYPFNKYGEEKLPLLNEEAGKARQPSWFICSFCRKAKPQSEYLISLDREKCCKSCGKKIPKWVEKAREYEKDPVRFFWENFH